MRYIEMTIEEAYEYYKSTPGKIVLVATQDLEKNDVAKFEKRNKEDCEHLIKEAETIARVYDDFLNQLKVFSSKQIDVRNIRSNGKLSTILLR